MPQLVENAATFKFRAVPFASVVFCGLLMGGCKNSDQTWSDEAKSPDARMVARAETFQSGGMGAAAPAETYVTLNWTKGPQKATLVLSIAGDPDVTDGLKVKMRWVNPRRLEITYRGNADIDFQAVRCSGIDINTQKE